MASATIAGGRDVSQNAPAGHGSYLAVARVLALELALMCPKGAHNVARQIVAALGTRRLATGDEKQRGRARDYYLSDMLRLGDCDTWTKLGDLQTQRV